MNFHGGDIYKYKDKEIIDFSSNINPLGIPNSFKAKLMENLEMLTKYPDIHYKELRESIAIYLEIKDIENIVVGNGAVEIIYKSIKALDIEKVLIATPTFSEYKRAAEIEKVPFEEIKTYREDGFTCLDTLVKKITPKSLVVLCNPNNPTGTLTTIDHICKLAQQLLGKKGYLLLDEAFIEFTPDYPKGSMVDKLKDYPNIIVVRAFTKFFGMPGIRLGYGIFGDIQLANNVREILEPWNINTAAVIAGQTVLHDKDYIDKSKQWLNEERSYMFNKLNSLEGVTVVPTTTNFMLLKINGMSPWQVKEKLLERDILIRTPEGFQGLDSNYFRVAIKDRISNNKLLDELYNIVNKTLNQIHYNV